MILKYIIRSHVLTHLRFNLCDNCFSRFLSTKSSINLSKISKTSKKSFKKSYLQIIDKNTAEMVSRFVTSELSENSVIFEANPGNGILTEELLKSCVQSVRVFEENPIFLNKLENLRKQYPNRLQIIAKQILNFRFSFNYLNEKQNQIWFKDIPKRDWRSTPALKFVAILSPQNSLFIRSIIKLLLKKELFFSFGRIEFFVFISENEYTFMSAKAATNYKDYRGISVLYNTVFDIQTLETLPYNTFDSYTPNDDKSVGKNKMKGKAKLVRLTPKLYLDDYNCETLQDYYFFVSQMFMKRTNYVIPFLEKWFPNCGPDLIKKGIPVFKHIGDLEPEQVFDIFIHLKSCADYENSLYKSLAINRIFDFIESDIKDIEEDNYLDKPKTETDILDNSQL